MMTNSDSENINTVNFIVFSDQDEEYPLASMNKTELGTLYTIIEALKDIHTAAKEGDRRRYFCLTDLEEENQNLINLISLLKGDLYNK